MRFMYFLGKVLVKVYRLPCLMPSLLCMVPRPCNKERTGEFDRETSDRQFEVSCAFYLLFPFLVSVFLYLEWENIMFI